MPKIPSIKLYLNLVYNTGLPGGSPSYSDPYLYQNRLRDYRRADVGFSKVLIDAQNPSTKKWLQSFKELAIGLEIFNLFDNQNAITNTWVRDVYSKNQYAIPNYMTTRVFNVKVNMRFWSYIKISLSKSDFSILKSNPNFETNSITRFLYQFSDLGWM